jgi:hypothetical protein
MMARLRVGALALVLVAGAVFLAIVLVGGGSAPVVPPRHGIGVATSVSPETVLFGAPTIATVDAVVDRRVVDPGSLALRGGFAPYVPAAAPSVTRSTAGPLTRVRFRLRLECLLTQCLPPDPSRGGRAVVQLPSVRLLYTRRDGRHGAAPVTWPTFVVASRLAVGDFQRLTLLTEPPFHASVSLPPPSWAVSPALLVRLFAAGGAVLIAAAVALLVLGTAPVARIVGAVRRRRRARRTPVERALAAVQRARAEGVVEEQRKALDQLAEALRGSGEEQLAGSAATLAWSDAPPGADATAGLAATVQEQVGRGVNGHGRARR